MVARRAAALLSVVAVRTNLGWGPLGERWVQAADAPGLILQVAALTLLVLPSAALPRSPPASCTGTRPGSLLATAVGAGVVVELVAPPPLTALTAAALLAAGAVSVRRVTRPADSA